MIIVENNTLSIRPPHSFLNYIVVTELLQTGAYKTITKPTERVRSSDKEKKNMEPFPTSLQSKNNILGLSDPSETH